MKLRRRVGDRGALRIFDSVGEDPMACHQFHRGTLRVQKGSSRVDSGAWLPRHGRRVSEPVPPVREKFEVSHRRLRVVESLLNSLVLLLVILVRSLRHQRMARFTMARIGGALNCMGLEPFPFWNRQWGRSYSMPSPRKLCYKKAPQVRPRMFE